MSLAGRCALARARIAASAAVSTSGTMAGISLALVGIVFKLYFTGRYKFVSTMVYLAMGWMAVVAARPFLHSVPLPIVCWLLAGGLSYTLGTIFYLAKHRHAHAVWHGFVLLGSACHFVAVSLLVLAAH